MIMPFDKKAYSRKSFPKRNVTPYKAKRGNLKPLMSEDQKTTANIQELSYDFACRIIRLFQYLTEDADYKEYILSKQVYRSGTSIGANTREAQHAQSDADFLSKMQIAHKEADEPMEQREESQACLIYPESGQRKTKSNLLLAFVVA